MKENKKLSMEELRKIVSENAFKILEDILDDKENTNDLDASPESNIDTPPIDKAIDNSLEKIDSNKYGFENLSEILKTLSSKIEPKKLEEINSEILKAISTGRINRNYTFEKMVSVGVDKNLFDYFVTTLATLYKNSDASEQKNIRQALFLAFPVYNSSSVESGSGGETRASSFTNLVAKKSGIGYSLRNAKTIDGSYYIDIIADSIYDAIDYAIKNYDASRGGTFSSVVLFKAASNAKDALGSKLHKKTFSVGGEKSSLDEPLGDDGADDTETAVDRITGREGEMSVGEKEAIKGFAGALKSFVQEKLGQKESLKNYLDFFNLFTQGHSLSEIADIMEKNPGNLRVIKKRMEDFITKFVESGELQDYIGEETGLKVDFPKNKFSLSVQGTGKGEGEVEPVEYFQVTGNNPETGEPVGEWVKITPETHDSETTWFNNYGDLVFGREEQVAEPSLETNDEEEENRLAESLMKIIQKRIGNA